MRKKLFLFSLIAIAIIAIVTSQYPKLYIATGYGAKCLASGIFVAERDPVSVKILDLNYSIVKYTRSKIDYNNKSVTTSFFGLASKTAIYNDNLGCILNCDGLINEIRKRPSPKRGSYALTRNYMWPMGDNKKDTIFPEIEYSRLKNAVSSAFDLPQEVKQKQTASVLVVYKGEIVAEKYWDEMDISKNTRLCGWSMNKSVENALIGILVKGNKLDINATAPIPEWISDKRKDITLNNLLQMSSGLKWNEDYGDISDATNMLYNEPDCYQFAIKSPLETAPNSKWYYSSGTANIVSGIIRSVFKNDSLYYQFPYEKLFDKIGMHDMVLETDAKGNFILSSYGHATTRDWARIGLLFYNNGISNGDSILPKGWVDYTRTPAKASKGKYGALFWLNQSSDLPDAPKDMFICQGHRGQRIYIIPSKDLVIVRLGFSEKEFDHNAFIKGIIDSRIDLNPNKL